MVHLVQAPEQWHLVGGEVLRPDGEIKHQQRDHQVEPIRPVDLVEQAKLVLLREERRGDRGNRYREGGHKPQDQNTSNAKISEPASRLEDAEPTLRADELDRRQEKHAGKDREANEPIALAKKTVHRARLAGKGQLLRLSARPCLQDSRRPHR